MNQRAIYGDFQTPDALAEALVTFVADRFDTKPDLLVEPTVGRGSVLAAALARFEHARALGVDVSAEHLRDANARFASFGSRVRLVEGDAFSFDFAGECAPGERVLFVGNPPWVTSAAMPRLGGSNLPAKSNRDGSRGLDAKTGRANFDVAEWLLSDLVDRMRDRDATFGFLVKSQVARRLVAWAERTDAPLFEAAVVSIDSSRWFGAAVDACIFAFRTRAAHSSRDVARFDSLVATSPSRILGTRDGIVVADVEAFEASRELFTASSPYVFRSGIKHDCADVFELVVEEDRRRTRTGELVDVEDEVRLPFVKGGDLGRTAAKRRELLVTQRSLGEDTSVLATTAPRAFAYLERHGERLDARKSSIYRGRPRFAMFGVGPYAFAPYKVAVFGLAKRPEFHVVGPRDGRPAVFDDTTYYLPFDSREAAEAVARTLSTDVSRRALAALVFTDAKRPITKEVLGRLDLVRIASRACELGQIADVDREIVSVGGTGVEPATSGL